MGASEKAAATYHPNAHECPVCAKPYASQGAATDCCGAWLDDLD